MKSSKIKNRPDKRNAIETVFKSMGENPWDIQILEYERQKEHGTVWHLDAYSTFGTAICILKDSSVGRLHIEGIDVPEGLQAGDVILIDPNTRHKVQIAARNEERVVVTFVF